MRRVSLPVEHLASQRGHTLSQTPLNKEKEPERSELSGHLLRGLVLPLAILTLLVRRAGKQMALLEDM